jgi:hypothetical protein
MAASCACCLLDGRCSSPAPGDRVSPGHLDAGAVKGRPKAERALMSAQRPLTAEGLRWQSVQQASGPAGPCGVAVPARQRRRRG